MTSLLRDTFVCLRSSASRLKALLLEAAMSKRTLALLLLPVSLAFAVSCGGDDGPSEPRVRVVARVEVSPQVDTLTALGETYQYAAVASDAEGEPISGLRFVWMSSDPGVATVDTAGLVTARATGGTTIIASTQDVPGQASVTVVQVIANLEVNPSEGSLSALDDTVRFSAVVEDANGNVVPDALSSWESRATNVATVDSTGLVRAVGDGAAIIVASARGVADSASVTVQRVVTSVQVNPTSDTLTTVGSTVQLSAVANDANNNEITGASLDWSSSDSVVALVSGTGLVTAVGNGTATITARVGNESDYAIVTVDAVAAVELSPASGAFEAIGDTLRLFAVAKDSNGVEVPGVRFDWQSSNPSMATVDSTGLVRATGPGNVTITAEANGVSGKADLFVPLVSALTVGEFHSCALLIDGRAYCWGFNEKGSLGDGTMNHSSRPGLVSGVIAFAALSARGYHTTGISTSGVGYAWGGNFYGELGHGVPPNERTTPSLVSGGFNFEDIATGQHHTCGVIDVGDAYCWGRNNTGQLGDGSTVDTSTPVQVSGGPSFASLSLGAAHTCGLTSDGTAYCWGFNSSGQLGDGTTSGGVDEPTAVLGGLNFTTLTVGLSFNCGLRAAGNVYCWGNNEWGQLGDGTTTNRTSPVLVSGGLTFTSIGAGYFHACGVAVGGDAYCWGQNMYAQLGDGTSTGRTTPGLVSGGLGFKSVRAGEEHSCAVGTDGVVYCWGRNGYGQLGDRTNNSRYTPVPVIIP